MTTENNSHAAASVAYRQYMKFGVLGPVLVAHNGRHRSVGGPKQRTVLALLIARAGESVSTESLMQGVYGSDAPPTSRRSIQTYVSNLRGELGDVITATGSGYTLVAARSEIDALAFEDMVGDSVDDSDPESTANRLRDALALWRGHPYADVDGMAELTTEVARLNELRATALEKRIAAELELGHHRDLVAELESLTGEYPLRDRFRSQQMLALYRSGRQAEALRAYEKTRTYLVEEMGLDPSRELRDMEQRILEQDPTLNLESGPTVRRVAILVADVADPRMLPNLDSQDRAELVRLQAEALEDAAHDHDGAVFAQRGSAMYASFGSVEHAAGAASAAQQALAGIRNPMRMAISVGEVQIPSDGSVQGPPVTRAAQLVATAHGGQVLLSVEANQALVDSGAAGWIVRALGQHDIEGSGEPRAVYQLMVDGLPREFPALRTELLPPPLPVEVRGLPGYELREQVGSGAFGVVHRAYQPSVGREVAIKIIKPEYANDPDFIRHFEVEAQLVARLEHPHIVPLHDYWRTPEGAYLVMRWLGGGTLQDRIATGPLPIDDAHAILADIGPALAFAHRRGVVHRDIKASNVLLDDEGGAYLSDFGIASNIERHGAGSITEDVRALAGLLLQCIGTTEEEAVDRLLETATLSEHFPDVRSFIEAWEDAVGAGNDTSQVVGYTPTRNPYKGLSAFGELDAADFHGRDAEVEEILSTLSDHRLAAVVGPSGIGKSSVVRAGMIPALRAGAIPGSERWLITDMLPGAYPYEELTSALMRIATEMPNDLEEDLRRDARGLARSVRRYLPEGQTVLLIVDQFEELFTLAGEDERTAFLAMLAATISDDRSNIRIVITMRADFFDRPLRFADLGDALRTGTVPISAPGDEALRAIVAEPATGVGVAFEPGLVDQIIGDVKHQPGALPLLEFSLTELFDQRDSDQLTIAAYLASGGVLAALGRRAEAIYSDLDPRGRDAARETFLRLVNVTEAGRDTRRRVRLSELERLGFTDVVLRGMLETFGDHRLLTFDRDPITRGPTIEVAHEAILTEWPRLAAWIEDHREDLLLRSRLAVAVADWENAERADTYLLTGGRLDQHEAWTADTDLALTTAEEEFLTASRTAEDERRARRRRTRRLVMSGFGIAAIIALVLAVTALIARNDAQDQAAIAEANQETALENETLAEENAAEAEANAARAASERQVAQAGALGAAALDQISTDPELALLLGIESLRKVGTPAGINATHSALFNHYAVWTLLADILVLVPQDMPWAVHPDGERVLVWEEAGSLESIPARFALYDTTRPDQTPEWMVDLTGGLPIDYNSAVAWFDDDVVLIAVNDLDSNPAPASSARGVYIVDLETGDVLDTVQFGDCTLYVYPAVPDLGRASPLIVGNGDLDETTNQCVAGGATYQTVRYFRGGVDGTSSMTLEFPEPFQWFRYTPHATDDGQLIAFGAVPDLYIFDADTGKPVDTYEGDRIAISGDGDQLLISRLDLGFVQLVDRESGDVLRTFSGEYLRITFSSDDTRFVGSSYDGGVHVFDLSTGTRTHDLRGTHYNPYQVSLADDPDTLLAASNDSGRLFKLGNRSEIPVPMTGLGERLESWGHGGHHSAVSVGGGLVYVPFVDSEGTGYRIFDLVDGTIVREATNVWRVAAMTSDGKYVVEIPRLETGVTDPDGATAELFGQMQIVDARTGKVVLVFDSTCGFYGTDLWADIYIPNEDCDDGQLFLPLSDAEFSADGSRLGVDSFDKTPAVFDTKTGELLWHTVLDRDGAFGLPSGVVGLSPDGETFIYRGNSVDSDAQTLTAINVDTGTPLGEADQINPNYEIVFSEDGSRVYTANWAYVIYVYDAETFELVDTLTRGQGGGILDVAVRGNLVATVGFDKVVRVQTLDKHKLMLELELEVKAENVEFLDDNRLLVITLSEDAFIFTMDPEELSEIAKQRLTRGFSAEECSSFDIDPCPTLAEIRAG